MNKSDNTQTDLSGNKQMYPDNPYPFVISSEPQKKNNMSGGMIFLVICMYILFAMLLPSCILFFITKWSAKSAIKSTVCSNPEILRSLFSNPPV